VNTVAFQRAHASGLLLPAPAFWDRKADCKTGCDPAAGAASSPGRGARNAAGYRSTLLLTTRVRTLTLQLR